MNPRFERPESPHIWPVGALCRAVADALAARFNPVSVSGEISGFARAASGHCYFVLRDENGQMRCAMFRRAAALLDFAPADGLRVEVRGRLDVYDARGELQIIVESLQRAGQGSLFEQFLQLKNRLQAEGLFDAQRKRPLPAQPRAIGIVSSTEAAALHDAVTALRRRVPHIPVLIAAAPVQGRAAPPALIAALQSLQKATATAADGAPAPVDVILLVRGGGSIEDLWAFNDEQLIRAIANSATPVICGVGHETDFTLADFAADLRAPTPTAAAELAATARSVLLTQLQAQAQRLDDASARLLDAQAQRLDQAALRLGRPLQRLAQQRLALQRLHQQCRHGVQMQLRQHGTRMEQRAQRLPQAVAQFMQAQREQLSQLTLRLQLLDPAHVLQRGYAWLQSEEGRALGSAARLSVGQNAIAVLHDGRANIHITQVQRTGES